MTHQQKYTQRMTKYEEMGIASLLPGMLRLHEMMGEAITEVQEQLARVQERLAEGPDETKVSGQKAYWMRMSPEERAAEMRRRGMKGRKKLAGKKISHPRNPDHPGHKAWKAKLSKKAKAFWSNAAPKHVNGAAA